jgi:dihydrofolate synthase/folylpolyglutamate synthase
MKLGLDNIRALLEYLGNPQDSFETIHIAGSNGKGSVSAMLAAAMQGNNYKTGLYTSPHLVNFRERIRINGQMITETYMTTFLEKIWDEVERIHATFFEVTTALAFSYFADNKVNVAIIETGLGGRLDATNILRKPLATAITSISLEHTQKLGNTVEEIAGEKAGIMKAGVPAIVNVEKNLEHVFSDKVKTFAPNEPRLIFARDLIPGKEYSGLQLPFIGQHQQQNLHTVLATLGAISLPLKPDLIISGIENTQMLTGMRGRLENYPYTNLSQKDLTLILDVAHNPDAFHQLKLYFNERAIRPVVIAGFAKDKDIATILTEIRGFASRFVAVAADSHRALETEELARMAELMGLEVINAGEPKQAVDDAIAAAAGGETILLTGSHYVIGDFLRLAEAGNESKL